MVIPAVLFFGSCIGICILFGIKYWEVTRGHLLAPKVRTKADERALEIKNLLVRGAYEAAKLPPASLRFIRFLVRESALLLAGVASAIERYAHKLADFVSHKRGFERRAGRGSEPRSEFLKRMGETDSERLDAEEGNGHNT